MRNGREGEQEKAQEADAERRTGEKMQRKAEERAGASES